MKKGLGIFIACLILSACATTQPKLGELMKGAENTGADQKLSELTPYSTGPASSDYMYIVDDETTDVSKSITVSYLFDYLGSTSSKDAVFNSVTTTGPIKGTVDTIGSWSSPTTSNPYAPTAAVLRAGFVYYGVTGEIDLPDSSDGDMFCVYATGAYTITIDPYSTTEYIVREGTAQGAGVSMTLTAAAAGDYVCMVSDGTYWVTVGFSGTLAAGS